MTEDCREYNRDREYGRTKRGGSPPFDQGEYERPRRRMDDYSIKIDDGGYRAQGYGYYSSYRGSYGGGPSYLPRDQYLAVSRIVDQKLERVLRERDYGQHEQNGTRSSGPPPPPARGPAAAAAPPKSAADPATVEQLAAAKLQAYKLQQELEKYKVAEAKRKEQKQKQRAKRQQKKAAAAAETSEEESQPDLGESAAETSEQLATLSFKDALVGAAAGTAAKAAAASRRKSSPAVLADIKQEPGAADRSLPIKLVQKLLGLSKINESGVKKAISSLYEGAVSNLQPLWQVVLPNQDLPATKAEALGAIYQAIKGDISSLKG